MDGKITDKNSLMQLTQNDIMEVSNDLYGSVADADCFLADLSGQKLDTALVRKTMAEDMKVFAE